MRIRWVTASPDRAAIRLAHALGLIMDPVGGRREVGLGSVVLELVALPSGVAGDDRLSFAGPVARPPDAHSPGVACVGVGVATVDTDRIASRMGWRIAQAGHDLVLGAHVAAADASPGEARLVVLEPSREGRVAASLARLGEGPVALYLRSPAGLPAARDWVAGRGGKVTPIADGPFGRSFAIGGGPPWGPHLVIVESDALSWSGSQG